MSPAEYGASLAAALPPITDAQVHEAALVLVAGP